MQISKTYHGGAKSILLSIIFCVALYPLVSLILSLFCYLNDDPLSNSMLFSLVSIVLSGALSGVLSSLILRCNFPKSIVSLLGTALIFFAVGLIVTKGAVPAGFFMNILCYALPFVFLSFIIARRGSSKNKRKYKRFR